MRGYILSLLFLFFSLSVDAQEDWVSMNSEDFWSHPALDSFINVDNFNRDLLEIALFHATNDIRIARGKNALKWNSTLHKAARHQADLMAESENLSHNWRKPKNSRTLGDRVGLFGGEFRGLGENIARFYLLDIPAEEEYFFTKRGITNKDGKIIKNKTYKVLAQECLAGWMDSKGHRANILSPFIELGTGVSFWVDNKKGPNFDIYLSQNFATP